MWPTRRQHENERDCILGPSSRTSADHLRARTKPEFSDSIAKCIELRSREADAQISGASLCSITSTSTSLTCTGGIFTTLADAGKTRPGAGANGTAPAPNSTLLATISAVVFTSGLDTGTGKFKNATLSVAASNTVSNVPVTWGTDNAGAFQTAVNSCPPPTNPSSISPFTSKGCVIVVPNPGSAGTGDYMFGSGIVSPVKPASRFSGWKFLKVGRKSAVRS